MLRRSSCIERALARSLASVAGDLDVSVESLRSWVKQAEIDAGEREGLTSGKREELQQLRRENVRLRQEREILIGGGLTRTLAVEMTSIGCVARHRPRITGVT